MCRRAGLVIANGLEVAATDRAIKAYSYLQAKVDEHPISQLPYCAGVREVTPASEAAQAQGGTCLARSVSPRSRQSESLRKVFLNFAGVFGWSLVALARTQGLLLGIDAHSLLPPTRRKSWRACFVTVVQSPRSFKRLQPATLLKKKLLTQVL